MHGNPRTVLLLTSCLAAASFSSAQDLENIQKKQPVKLSGNFSAGLNYNTYLSNKDSMSKPSFGSSLPISCKPILYSPFTDSHSGEQAIIHAFLVTDRGVLVRW